MKPVDEMTLDEVRDEIAASFGWEKQRTRWKHPQHNPGGSWTRDHPIPATLDAAAELPEGLMVKIEQITATHWVAKAFTPDGKPYSYEADGPAELLARFRLRLAVLRATKKGASDGLDG